MLPKTLTNSLLLVGLSTSMLLACSANQDISANKKEIFATELYAPVIEEQALRVDKSQLITVDSNEDGIPDQVDAWISELNEPKVVTTALRRFAQSIQNAILLEGEVSTNISGPIMYNIVQSGYDIMLFKGVQDGRKLLDSLADQICDTRVKSVKYMHFLKNFEPANNIRQI